jgi:hypothetical protein
LVQSNVCHLSFWIPIPVAFKPANWNCFLHYGGWVYICIEHIIMLTFDPCDWNFVEHLTEHQQVFLNSLALGDIKNFSQNEFGGGISQSSACQCTGNSYTGKNRCITNTQISTQTSVSFRSYLIKIFILNTWSKQVPHSQLHTMLSNIILSSFV